MPWPAQAALLMGLRKEAAESKGPESSATPAGEIIWRRPVRLGSRSPRRKNHRATSIDRDGPDLFLSGHIAKKDGKSWAGQLGQQLTTEQGKEAARAVAIDLLGTLQAAVGDLERVQRIVKLMVLVNSAPSFTEQHLVANGASELFVQVFGEKGKHARCAFGAAQIPFGSCVEIDLVAEVL